MPIKLLGTTLLLSLLSQATLSAELNPQLLVDRRTIAAPLQVQSGGHAIVSQALGGASIALISGRSDLWRSDGTDAGTYLLRDVDPSELSGAFTEFYKFGNESAFFGYDGSFGEELWCSDGSCMDRAWSPMWFQVFAVSSRNIFWET